MKKRLCVLLFSVVFAMSAPLYAAQDNSGAWTVGILVGGFLAGSCYAFLVGDQQEDAGGFWGTYDNHTFHAGPIFSSTWTDQSNKISDSGAGIDCGYRAMLHAKDKWFGIVRNGWEADGDVIATFTSNDGLRFLTGAIAVGPNFSLFELGETLRITCGVGYMCNIIMINAFYFRPGIDFRVTDFLTLNAMYFQTFFGGYGDPTTPSFTKCSDSRLEVGASWLIGGKSDPAALSLRYRYGAIERLSSSDAGKLQYHSVDLSYTYAN
jgi:hypothetical protein